MTDHIICGWRVRSSLPLPETLTWTGPDRPVDIEIRRGAVPTQVGRRTADLPYIEMAPDGRLLVEAMPDCRFLVTSDSVVVDARAESQVPEWRAYLLGPVLAVLCYLRGALPLHASALRVGGRTVAIAGRSGAGKSTLAAALAQRGHSLITDDICPCIGFPESPLALPTYPAIKLTRASLEALDLESDHLSIVDPDLEKLQLPQPEGFDPAPVRLEIVYLIEDAQDGTDDTIIATTGAEAFTLLCAEVYRPPIGRLLLAKPAFFTMATQLATGLSIRRLVRRHDFTRLQTLAGMIEADTAYP